MPGVSCLKTIGATMTEKETMMARRQRPGIIESDMGDSNRKNPVTRPMAMTIERMMSVNVAKSNMKKIFLEKHGQ